MGRSQAPPWAPAAAKRAAAPAAARKRPPWPLKGLSFKRTLKGFFLLLLRPSKRRLFPPKASFFCPWPIFNYLFLEAILCLFL